MGKTKVESVGLGPCGLHDSATYSASAPSNHL